MGRRSCWPWAGAVRERDGALSPGAHGELVATKWVLADKEKTVEVFCLLLRPRPLNAGDRGPARAPDAAWPRAAPGTGSPEAGSTEFEYTKKQGL